MVLERVELTDGIEVSVELVSGQHFIRVMDDGEMAICMTIMQCGAVSEQLERICATYKDRT